MTNEVDINIRDEVAFRCTDDDGKETGNKVIVLRIYYGKNCPTDNPQFYLSGYNLDTKDYNVYAMNRMFEVRLLRRN